MGARKGNAPPKMTFALAPKLYNLTVVVFGKLLMKFLVALKAKHFKCVSLLLQLEAENQAGLFSKYQIDVIVHPQ